MSGKESGGRDLGDLGVFLGFWPRVRLVGCLKDGEE